MYLYACVKVYKNENSFLKTKFRGYCKLKRLEIIYDSKDNTSLISSGVQTYNSLSNFNSK